jgi:hypothetical protein
MSNRGSTTGLGFRLLLLGLVLALAVVVAIPSTLVHESSASPSASLTPAVSLSGLSVNHFVDGDAAASLLAGSYAHYVRGGDRFDLSLGNPNHSSRPNISLSMIRTWLSILNHHWASGAFATGGGEKIIHTSGYANAAYAARYAPSEIGAISEDWEPYFEPEFTFTFTKVLYWAEKLDSVAHHYHRQAWFFVTGRGLGQYSGSWNYGRLATKLDHVTVQMQANCLGARTSVGMAEGVRKLVDQFRQYHQPLSKLTVVVSIPDEYNAVSPSHAASCIRTALSAGVPGAEAYWSPSKLPSLYAEMLRYLGR